MVVIATPANISKGMPRSSTSCGGSTANLRDCSPNDTVTDVGKGGSWPKRPMQR